MKKKEFVEKWDKNSKRLKVKIVDKELENYNIKHGAICRQCDKHNNCPYVSKLECEYWNTRTDF